MYRISLSSILVVLVTLQQHNQVAAQSLCDQFDELFKGLCIENVCENGEIELDSESICYQELLGHFDQLNAHLNNQSSRLVFDLTTIDFSVKKDFGFGNNLESQFRLLDNRNIESTEIYFNDDKSIGYAFIENVGHLYSIDKLSLYCKYLI